MCSGKQWQLIAAVSVHSANMHSQAGSCPCTSFSLWVWGRFSCSQDGFWNTDSLVHIPQVPTRPLSCTIISSFLPSIPSLSSPSSSSSLSFFSRQSLTVLSRLASILKFFYLFLPYARIMELCHHTWLNFGTVICQRMFCLFMDWTLEPVLRMEFSTVWIRLLKARGTGHCN